MRLTKIYFDQSPKPERLGAFRFFGANLAQKIRRWHTVCAKCFQRFGQFTGDMHKKPCFQRFFKVRAVGIAPAKVGWS
jgi:hypothetical protein